MRLERLTLKNVGILNDVTLDLTAIPGKLIAVVGPNGAGKTTLLECFPGALYRKTPSRGPIGRIAREGAIGSIEARVVNGAAWTIRHTFGDGGNGESVVFDADGRPAYDSAKRKAFDDWSKKNLPAQSVFEAAQFGCQGGDGLIGLDPGERKAVLLRVLGIEYLEDLADRARKRARAAEVVAAGGRGKLDAARAGTDAPEMAAAALAEAEEDAATASDWVARVSGEVADAEKAEAAARDRARLILEHDVRIGGLEQTKEAHQRAIEDARLRAENNRKLVGDAARILEADAALPELRSALDGARGAVGAAAAALKSDTDGALDAERRAREAGAAADGDEVAAEDGAARTARARTQNATERARLVELETDRADKEAARADAESAVAQLGATQLSSAQDRIGALKWALGLISGRIREEGGLGDQRDDQDLAESALVADDKIEDASREHPAKFRAAREALAAATERANQAASALRTCRERIVDDERIAEWDRLVTERRERAAKARASSAADAARAVELREGLKAKAEEHAKRLATYRNLEERLAETERAAKHADKAREAEERIRALEATIVEARGAESAIIAELTKLGARGADLGAMPDVAAAAGATAAAKSGHASAVECREEKRRAVDRLRARHDAAIAAAERVSTLEEEQAGLDAAVADWTKIGQDLGRDGLQALEIDAAIPELTELTNDLLRKCFGARWTISIETTYSDAEGKRTLEGLPIRVVDSQTSFAGDVREFSGGERVILGEALALALTLAACRRSGLRGVTLVRDETGAALERENAAAYVAMLRRAAELVDADHVLIVSHFPDVQALADARVLVGPNGIEIQE